MRTVRASDYHDIATVSDPDVSPDGERVAFVRTEPEDEERYAATVHVARVGGESRRFTADAGVDAEPRWSPSGDRLAFASTRGGDGPQLWVLPADGGEARRVTTVPGGVSDVEWRPDGRRIAFVQAVTAEERAEGRDVDAGEGYEREAPDPRVVDRTVYRTDGEYLDGARKHVYVADPETGEVARRTDGDRDHHAPTWDAGGALYYAVERADPADDRYDVDVRDGAGGARTLVETTGPPALAAAGDGRVAYVRLAAENRPARQTDLRILDRRSGETVTATAGLDRTVDADVGPAWDPAGEYCYFLTPEAGDVVLRRTRADGRGSAVVVGEGHVDGVGVGADWVAVTKSEWDHPGDVFASTPAGGESVRLTRVNADYLEDRAVGQPEEVRFGNGAGDDLQGWVLTPPAFDPAERYPLVVEAHDGPHAMWSTSGGAWHEFQTLAARGYVVFWSNPRGSTGYGADHARAVERDWGGIALADVLAGVERVAARDHVDADDVFLTGEGFGGYLTAWAVGHTDRFRAAAARRGVYDLIGFYGSTDAAYRLLEWEFGATPWEDPELLWNQSPAAHADRVTTPTLVMHDADDYRAPAGGAELLYRALRQRGVDTRLVRYSDGGDGRSRSGRPAHVVDRIERVARWFDGYSAHVDASPPLEGGAEASDGNGAGDR